MLPCFSKILERITYNRLYNYLIENNILYSKQFGFQNGHSTENETQNLRPKTMDTCHIWDLRSRALIRTKKNKNPQQESYTGETKTQDMNTDVKTQDLSSKI